MGCVKCMGLRRGETIERLGTIRVIGVRRERLGRILLAPDYGRQEMEKEGFPGLDTNEFINRYFRPQGLTIWNRITRIEFEYLRDYCHHKWIGKEAR